MAPMKHVYHFQHFSHWRNQHSGLLSVWLQKKKKKKKARNFSNVKVANRNHHCHINKRKGVLQIENLFTCPPKPGSLSSSILQFMYLLRNGVFLRYRRSYLILKNRLVGSVIFSVLVFKNVHLKLKHKQNIWLS